MTGIQYTEFLFKQFLKCAVSLQVINEKGYDFTEDHNNDNFTLNCDQ